MLNLVFFTLQYTKVVQNYGRKIVHRVMKAKKINVGETKIGKLLSEINPEAQPKRQNVVGRSLNPKVYNAKIFVDKIHYDQNQKLGIFRVVRVCARNGISGKIVGHAKIARKNNLVIYEEVYRLITTFFIYKDNAFRISQIF